MKSVLMPALLFLLYCPVLTAQTGQAGQTGNTGNDKLDEMRRLKEQMEQDQKTLQQQQEWNNSSAQQELKQVRQENQQKNSEIQASKQEAQSARLEAQKAKTELEAKKIELLATQLKIDSAKQLLDSTTQQLEGAEMTVKRTTEALLHQEDSVKLLNEKHRVEEIALSAERQKTRLSVIAAVLALGLLIVSAIMIVFRQRSMNVLAAKNKEIKEEQRRSEELLLNILPHEIMTELRAHGKTKARNYLKATVLFADIKDFTSISEQLTPDELIEALDAYFERFDQVIERYKIEKIKTIGDAYVCAGGLPTSDEVNPELVVEAATDFLAEIAKLKVDRQRKGLKTFEFRIGIHTGNLIAGVVGIKKFAYDIWGDTVNMAARMQQNGEANKINISGATYELVKHKFPCVYRGKMDVKNKGEVDMYFVSTNGVLAA